MCTGLLAACICNHYQVLRWTTRCAENCLFPSNHLQRVDFQCGGCDALDQEILELEMAAQARVREAARETNRAGAWAQSSMPATITWARFVSSARIQPFVATLRG